MKTVFTIAGVFAAIFVALSGLGVVLAKWDAPRPLAKQLGFRGTGMQTLDNPRTQAAKIAAQKLPDVQDPADPGGPLASTVYQNVKVLGGLTENQFNRTMLAITTWVAPEQGCEYCHNTENMADDSKYTKIVARRMLQMTKTVNANYPQHVGLTGVTCYTCHRGNPVPQYIWFEQPKESRPMGMLGYRNGQNAPAPNAGYTTLSNDPFTPYLVQPAQIRVQAVKALPDARKEPGIQETELTYSLMMNMSQSLGVNCDYCHNSRAFGNWAQSTPQRVIAWHGIRMVRDLNTNFLLPLQGTWPANRLGAMGDGPKLYCMTCHQGLAKPLNGAPMHKDYPELDQVVLN